MKQNLPTNEQVILACDVQAAATVTVKCQLRANGEVVVLEAGTHHRERIDTQGSDECPLTL